MDDRQLRRAGLDYHEYARVQVHDSLADALAAITPPRLFALSSRGAVRYDAPDFAAGDAFLFGRETAGLPDEVLATIPEARSEEHTSELQSLMRISYAVFCLKKK